MSEISIWGDEIQVNKIKPETDTGHVEYKVRYYICIRKEEDN